MAIDETGLLRGVSVNSAADRRLEELTATIPNRQVGVTTVGAIRNLGGDVLPAPTSHNPFHAILGGITSSQAEGLFTPTTPNPNR